MDSLIHDFVDRMHFRLGKFKREVLCGGLHVVLGGSAAVHVLYGRARPYIRRDSL